MGLKREARSQSRRPYRPCEVNGPAHAFHTMMSVDAARRSSPPTMGCESGLCAKGSREAEPDDFKSIPTDIDRNHVQQSRTAGRQHKRDCESN